MRFPARFLALAFLVAPLCGAVQAAPASAAAKKPAAEKTAKPASDKSAYVTWVPIDKAAKAVSGSGKYLFVSVYTDWCGYCRKLNATTYRSAPVVAELDKNFASVRLNAESDQVVTWKGRKMTSRELATHWGVEGFPTLLFLNGKGDIVGSFQSYVEPELMIKLLTYISSGARERKVTFDDYLEGKG